MILHHHLFGIADRLSMRNACTTELRLTGRAIYCLLDTFEEPKGSMSFDEKAYKLCNVEGPWLVTFDIVFRRLVKDA